jgi:FkbM family methyltransferase
MNGPIDRLRDRLSDSLLIAAAKVATNAGWGGTLHLFGKPNMDAGLLALRGRGVSPRSAIDGGACMGNWTRRFLNVFPRASVLMIEPQERHAEALRQYAADNADRVKFAPALVGPPGVREVPFVVMEDRFGGTGSSVLPENSDIPRHTVTMPVATLDEVIAAHSMTAPDFIKLDVQGYELEVLKGARKALGQAEFVLLEVSTWQYNQGAPLLAEVASWMDAAGFRVYDMFAFQRRTDGVLLQIDLLFVRKTSKLFADTMTRFGVAP